MKTCSLLLRSWMVPLHPQFLQRSQATVSNFPMMRGHQAPSSISAFTNKNTASITRRGICLFQSPFHAKSGTYCLDGGRSLSLASPISYSQSKCLSSSSSSFEAPEPPKSKGQPVFPDIQFQNQSTPSSPKSENAAYARNSDPEAVFVVNGSSRGIGLQFVKSLAERSKVRRLFVVEKEENLNVTDSIFL